MTQSEQLAASATETLGDVWSEAEGRKVPEPQDVQLNNEARQVKVAVLYADLAGSCGIVERMPWGVAAKLLKCFLCCSTQVIRMHGGVITSFDGDRVMGVFLGDRKNTAAVRCGLCLHWAVLKLLQPRVDVYMAQLKLQPHIMQYGVGVDTGVVRAVRAGRRNNNDLIWVGRSPNLAARLSGLRVGKHRTFISDEVFLRMADDVKKAKDGRWMWEWKNFMYAGKLVKVHCSSWWMKTVT